MQENLFEWHFTVRGPEGSEFQVDYLAITLLHREVLRICFVTISSTYKFFA